MAFPSFLQLGLDETLRKIDAYGLPFHGSSHGHAASHSRQVRNRAESVCEVALTTCPCTTRRTLSLLTFSLCFPAECRLIL